MEIFSLDIETKAKNDSMKAHAALEPYRLRHGTAMISSIACCRPDNSVIQFSNCGTSEWHHRLKSLLSDLKRQRVYCHNTLFDTAWLIADLQPDRIGQIPQIMKDIKWSDTMLLTKWLTNGQLAEEVRLSYSLANLVGKFLPGHPMTEDFLKMKAMGFNAGDNEQYWLERGNADVILTRALAEYLQERLPVEQRVGVMTEFANILPVANSWIMGFHVNIHKLNACSDLYEAKKAKLAEKLGVAPTVISSPKQLAKLLFTDWGLTPIDKTPTGAPSTAAATLLWIKYALMKSGDTEMAERMGHIIDYKETTTLMSKYVKTTYEALEHTGDGYIYAAPRIFATYTGRMTYSNSTTSRDFEEEKKIKLKNGIAFHQMPRNAKEVREFLEPPPGMKLYEADAAGQESRLMALRSRDPMMLKVFKDKLDFHSMTGSSIIGVEYDEFRAKYKEQADEGGYYVEQRQLGKLANLSCNYRIGGKSLSEKSYVKYDTYMSVETGMFVVKAFNRVYEGVPQYWEDVVWESKQNGYTEAFGGRRFKLHKWSVDRWMTESSAINVPIQGAGASMKEIAIAETFAKVPDALFCLDLHDASFFYIPEDRAEEVASQLTEVLNTIDYTPYWNFTPEIELPYDSKFGSNFKEVK
jgi:DNA polymerase I-like protein with 3'-5' exonuclease and polymerase domains